jgi:hypothetical protein
MLDFVDHALVGQSASGTLNYRDQRRVPRGAGKCAPVGRDTGRCHVGGRHGRRPRERDHQPTFFNSNNHAQSKNNRLWYWDQNLIMSGNIDRPGCRRLGLYGTVIVRGNLTIDSGDCYAYTGPVPANAWKEYSLRSGPPPTTPRFSNQYPADNGFKTNRLDVQPRRRKPGPAGRSAGNTDVGIRGICLRGGQHDVQLALRRGRNSCGWWATWSTTTPAGSGCLVFYEPNFSLPLLNVVLGRDHLGRSVPHGESLALISRDSLTCQFGPGGGRQPPGPSSSRARPTSNPEAPKDFDQWGGEMVKSPS